MSPSPLLCVVLSAAIALSLLLATPTYAQQAAAATGDPQLVGLRGQSFQVHGVDQSVYNIISHPTHQLNTRFGFLSDGKCPSASVLGTAATNCWSHPGSYIVEVGIQQRSVADHVLHQLQIIAGAAEQGFAQVTFNGRTLTVGAMVNTTAMTVHYKHSHSIDVSTKLFTYTFENSDRFINQQTMANVPLHQLNSHGLLGQTWSNKKDGVEIPYIEGGVDDYTVMDGIFGTDFVYNLF